MKSEFLQCAEQKIAIDRIKCFLDVYLGTTHLRLLGILVELSHEFVGQENIVNNAPPLGSFVVGDSLLVLRLSVTWPA